MTRVYPRACAYSDDVDHSVNARTPLLIVNIVGDRFAP